ncbi:bifunctional folylpolyglutamate synthase/dihydrofolate synthase [Meiothermus granaticius NBRC 107808]|nr:bifunctional folylpolyglutamate synthase/dihydrofolate synthase [Meiothermus granaticius NBRC 107808]
MIVPEQSMQTDSEQQQGLEPSPQAYAEALEWLFGQTRAGAPRGLGRIRVLLERLGHPEQAFPAVQVIGTNGKGSVVAYLEAAFRAAGVRYGATTSPHLVEFRERIRTNAGQISKAEVTGFARWARNQHWDEHPAFFDLTTALAFRHFAQAGVEIAAVEAGVGGALDATSALERVWATIVTNVGEDHLEALGGSLEAVARDKAGAIRPGVPVLTGAEGIGLQVVREIAEERGAALYVLSEQNPLFDLPTLPVLKGRFQQANARLAVGALRLLGYPEAAISTGLSTALHPGRMHEFGIEGVRVVLDGAHNPPAARALAQEFTSYHLVFGGFPRKDYRAVLALLQPKARSLRYARAGKGALKAEVLQQEYWAPYFEEPLEALHQAITQAQQDGGPVLVTGSLYLVGAVLSGVSDPPSWSG